MIVESAVVWMALGASAKLVCKKAGEKLLSGAVDYGYKLLTAEKAGQALAGVYKTWLDGLLHHPDHEAFEAAFR